MKHTCVFDNSIKCDFKDTKDCNAMKSNENIMLAPIEEDKYCIGFRNEKLGKVYKIESDGKREQIKTSIFLEKIVRSLDKYKEYKDIDSAKHDYKNMLEITHMITR